MKTPIIVAHRGLHDREVENTLAAMLAAWDSGFTYCEIDIRGSLEHEPFLMHDATLDRTTSGRGPVDQAPSSTLKRVGVSSFAELLSAMPRDGKLFIEIKPEVSRQVIRRTMEACPADIGIVQSFDARVIAEARQVRHDIPLIELTDDAAKARFVASGVNALHKTLTPALVANMRGRGQWVGAWTPNEASEIERMLALDLDAITSDNPILVRDILAKIR